MAAPRGLKSLIQKTSPGKLVKAKLYTCYRATTATGRPRGAKLRGVARMLHKAVYSAGALPLQSDDGPSGYAGGKLWGGDGHRRGAAVDAQVSRLSKGSARARVGARQLQLTRHTFEALAYHKLTPIEAQRVVLDERKGLATAIDIVCTSKEHDDRLVLVELKTGYRGDRAEPVRDSFGKVLKMQAPLRQATDCALHRHLAQLAATHALFVKETGTVAALKRKGVTEVTGALLYVTPAASELHELSDWWRRRGTRLLERLASAR